MTGKPRRLSAVPDAPVPDSFLQSTDNLALVIHATYCAYPHCDGQIGDKPCEFLAPHVEIAAAIANLSRVPHVRDEVIDAMTAIGSDRTYFSRDDVRRPVCCDLHGENCWDLTDAPCCPHCRVLR